MAAVTSSSSAPPAQDARVPGHDIVSWAIDLLHAMGAPATPGNIFAMVTWANHESGGYRPGNPVGLYNPLNTTEGAKGYATQGGSQGNIKGFATYQQGIANQAYNLTHTTGAGYENIIAALKRGNDPFGVFRAVNASAFGTHNLPTSGTVPTTIPVHGATLTGFSPGDIAGGIAGGIGGALGGIAGIIGGPISGLISAGKATATLAGLVVNVFSNWRYVLEVLGGAAMVLLGVRLIIADITGRPVIPRPPAGAAAGAVALAAA